MFYTAGSNENVDRRRQAMDVEMEALAERVKKARGDDSSW
jgi:hypothetical protein